MTGDAFGVGMNVEDHRVARGNHPNGVIDDGRGWVGGRGDGSDDTIRGRFGEVEAVVACNSVGLEVLGAWSFFRNQLVLDDLVFVAAKPGLFVRFPGQSAAVF